MPRIPRLHYEGALYHVISRGNNKQAIFRHRKDYASFLDYLLKVKQQLPFKLHAYCLMPNHFHLLVEVGVIPLSIIMQRLLTGYTLYFNTKYKKGGHLFQGRYKAIVCEKESYLLELTRYIHLNPVRAQLVSDPYDWEWSGHQGYLKKSKNILLIEDMVLGSFSEDMDKARQLYAKFVYDGMPQGSQEKYYPQPSSPYLGDDDFVRQNAEKHEETVTQETDNIKEGRLDLKELVLKAARKMNVRESEVLGISRLKTVSKARRQFVLDAANEGYKAVDVAKILNRSCAFVSKVYNSSN